MRRIFLLVVGLLLCWTGTVQAHGLEPVRSIPAAGSTEEFSPSEVRIWFAEEVAVEGSWLRVEDAQGNQVDLGGGGVDLNDPQHTQLAVSLAELPRGTYRVLWQVALLDGDTSSGEFWFGVGDVSVPTPAPEETPAPAGQAGGITPGIWAILAIGVLLIGIALGIWIGSRRKID